MINCDLEFKVDYDPRDPADEPNNRRWDWDGSSYEPGICEITIEQMLQWEEGGVPAWFRPDLDYTKVSMVADSDGMIFIMDKQLLPEQHILYTWSIDRHVWEEGLGTGI
jgi:hypothetical protein